MTEYSYDELKKAEATRKAEAPKQQPKNPGQVCEVRRRGP